MLSYRTAHFVLLAILNVTFAATLFIICEAATALAQPPEVQFTLNGSSAYLFRGFEIAKGTVLQPSFSLVQPTGDSSSFNAGLWMSTPLDSSDPDNQLTEFDPSASYQFRVSRFTLDAGAVGYFYSDRPPEYLNTVEVFGSLAIETALDPVFTAYRDVRAFDSWTYELTFSHRFESDELGEDFNLTPFATFGFSSHGKRTFDRDGSDYVAYGFSTDLHWGPYVVTPVVTAMKGFDPGTTDRVIISLRMTFEL